MIFEGGMRVVIILDIAVFAFECHIQVTDLLGWLNTAVLASEEISAFPCM